MCLKEWLKTKRNVKESQNLNSYQWRTFECEICKTLYPSIFKAEDNKKYRILDINKPRGDYIILESITLEKNT